MAVLKGKQGFNPCFIGLASATVRVSMDGAAEVSFNPCFIGLASATGIERECFIFVFSVSILVLLD